MDIPYMPDKMLSVLRTSAGKKFFRGVLTPYGWRLQSRTTGKFVSVSRALGFAKGIGRLYVKTETLKRKIDYLDDEFWKEFMLDKEFREDVIDYVRGALGYLEVE